MRTQTCSEVLLEHLKQNRGWHKKSELYAVAEDWSPETCGRTLRELEEAKGLAKYAFEKQPELKTKVELVDGIARVTQYYE